MKPSPDYEQGYEDGYAQGFKDACVMEAEQQHAEKSRYEQLGLDEDEA